jgi:hypothetical protein
MPSLPALLRSIAGRLAAIVVVTAVIGRAREALRRRRNDATAERRAERSVLPSLYDRHPGAGKAPRRRIGLKAVDLDRIVGTSRHPSQNTADFLPLPHLRGQNWRARWQRISRAVDRLAVLPPVELSQVGDEYFVVDGHNRVAAARKAGAIEIDADVTQLLVPGVTQRGHASLDPSSMVGGDEVRMAGMGRLSRTVEQRSSTDDLSRRELVQGSEGTEGLEGGE